GTVDATVKLIRRAGGEVADAAFIISLPSLGGDARLTAAGIKVVSLVELAGE
ncbi:MAG: adenine phosphoribosyltransferase, partial [Aeromonas veronii]